MISLDDASNDNELLALKLFKAMDDGELPQALPQLCSEDFEWANSGLPTLRGQNEIRDHKICRLHDFYDVSCYQQTPGDIVPEFTLGAHRSRAKK